MVVGVDFDNTLVSYDRVFHRAAVEKGLIPDTVPATKGNVRDYLRQCGREDDWTELQGFVYGVAIRDAEAFPGAVEFFVECKNRGVRAWIISHKTRYPFRGGRYDLHLAAESWLESQGFLDTSKTGLSRDQVFLELTKQGKLQRIHDRACSHFIDDLPEFLMEPEFPKDTQRILFDPNSQHEGIGGLRRVTSWVEVTDVLFGGEGVLA
jgi:hypothetical protein